jgi:hypothetical protein
MFFRDQNRLSTRLTEHGVVMPPRAFYDASSVECAWESIRHRTNPRIITPVEQLLSVPERTPQITSLADDVSTATTKGH